MESFITPFWNLNFRLSTFSVFARLWWICLMFLVIARHSQAQNPYAINATTGSNYAATVGENRTYTYSGSRSGSYQSYSWVVTNGSVVANSASATSVTIHWDKPGQGQIRYQVPSGSYPYIEVDAALNVEVVCPATAGTTQANPIELGTLSQCGISQNQYLTIGPCHNAYYQTGRPAAYYRFTLSIPTTVTLNTCYSNYDTYVFLANANNVSFPFASNDNRASSGCSATSSFLRQDLSAGTYCIIVSSATADAGSATLGISTTPLAPTLTVVNHGPSSVTRTIGDAGTSITVTGADSYTWYPATGLNTTNGATVQASPTVSTTYTVVGTRCGLTSPPFQVRVRVIFSDRNYITTRSPQIADVRREESMDNLSLEQLRINTTYFDGLGRGWQSVARRAGPGPDKLDVVVPTTYDAYNRSTGIFLPYTQGNDGSFKTDALPSANNTTGQQAAFYQRQGDKVMDDAMPRVSAAYEASPLNRVEQQGAAGTAWQPYQWSPGAAFNHSIKQEQRSNTGEGLGNDDVLRWTYTAGATPSLAVGTPYAFGQLTVTDTYNEHNNRVLEYRDSENRVVLRKVQATTPNGGTVCNRGSEGASVSLTAPTGMVITGIQSATYGVGSGTCSDYAFTCSANVTERVRSLLAASITQSRQSVALTVNNLDLGIDPCPGSGKQLVVVATYAPVSESKAEFLETYYVYDDLGLLKAVVQPQGALAVRTSGSQIVSAAFLQKWCFLYKHDDKRRVIEKQVPGAGTTYYTYDQANRIVGVMDQQQAQTAGLPWWITKYDGQGRQILTAYSYLGKTRSALQNDLNNQPVDRQTVEGRSNTDIGYTLTQAYPAVQESDVQTITFYDDYEYLALGNMPFVSENGVTSPLAQTQGLVTGKKARVLGNTSSWTITKTFYDEWARAVQVINNHYPDGTTRTTTQLNFPGLPVSVLTTLNRNNSPHTIRNRYVYDHVGRMLRVYQQMEYGLTGYPYYRRMHPEVLVADCEYNAVGQLVDKKLHSTDWETISPASFLQSVDFRYTIRGWLSNINNRNLSNNSWERFNGADPNEDDLSKTDQDLFGMEIMYNENMNLSQSTPQYTGSISEVMWKTRGKSDLQKLRAYSYKYDKTDRITSADYRTYELGSNGYSWDVHSSNYSIPKVEYNANGNITRLERQGQISAPNTTQLYGDLDKLTFRYEGNGNQLSSVDEDMTISTAATHDFEDNGSRYSASLPEYTYDGAGRMTADANKQITVNYNILGLPARINFQSGKKIEYMYSAGGKKLSATIIDPGKPNKVTEYLQGFIYVDNELSFGPSPEGRVIFTSDAALGTSEYNWKYEYHLRDHLGNLRFAFRDDRQRLAQRIASMEPANAEQEEKEFANVAETRQKNAQHARTGAYVARLSTADGKRVGPSITWPVQAGDSVTAEAYGRYDRGPVRANLVGKGALILSAGTASTPTTAGTDVRYPITARQRKLRYAGLSFAVIPQLLNFRQEKLPHAFLQYELFNQDSQLVATQIKQLKRTSAEQWQHLEVGMKADSAGFVRVTVINESMTPAYFDDVVLRPVAPNEFQENHYDPWGLNLVGIEDEGGPDQKFQFSGMEKQDAFNLNWVDYGARFYDPQLGRWHTTDPFADSYRSLSPFQYAANNPIKYQDLDGERIIIYGAKKGFLNLGREKYEYKPEKPAPESFSLFIKQAVEALNYDLAGDKHGLIKRLAADPNNDVDIKQTDSQDNATYKSNRKTVFWNPYLMADLTFGGERSGPVPPAFLLFHEIGHGYRHAYFEDEYIYDLSEDAPKDPQYENLEERKNITLYEQDFSKYFRDQGINMGIRDNHSRKLTPLYLTDSPLSTKRSSSTNSNNSGPKVEEKKEEGPKFR